MGFTAQKWHGVNPTRLHFFLKSKSEKNMLKVFISIPLIHASSYGGAPSVMSLPLR